MRTKFLLIALLFLALAARAQHLPTASVYGKVTDEKGRPIEMANVIAVDLLVGQTTNARGAYELSVLSDTTLTISFSYIGFDQKQVKVRLKEGEKRKLDVTLHSIATDLPDVVISDRGAEASSLTRLNPKQATLLLEFHQRAAGRQHRVFGGWLRCGIWRQDVVGARCDLQDTA